MDTRPLRTWTRCAGRHPTAVLIAVLWMTATPLAPGAVAAAETETAEDTPVIAGRTLGEWRQVMSQLDLKSAESAQYVPGLIDIVTSDAAPWFTRRQAALTLGRLGRFATPAVPVLIGQLRADDTENSTNSSDAPELVPERQLWAVKALGLFGPLAASATPRLTDLYEQPTTSPLIAMSIIDTLSQIGPHHPLAIPFLLRVAGQPPWLPPAVQADPDGELTPLDLRLAAVESLGLIGPAASVALPQLLRVLDEPEPSLRREAVTTLGRFGPAAATAQVALFERLLADPDAAVQDAAATALGRIGAREIGESLVPLFDIEDAATRIRLLGILRDWQAVARPWTPQVVAAERDPDPTVRLAAYEAHWKISGAAETAAAGAVAEFRHADHAVRREAYRLFERLGEAQLTVETELEALLRDARPEVRQVARQALRLCHERRRDAEKH